MNENIPENFDFLLDGEAGDGIDPFDSDASEDEVSDEDEIPEDNRKLIILNFNISNWSPVKRLMLSILTDYFMKIAGRTGIILKTCLNHNSLYIELSLNYF